MNIKFFFVICITKLGVKQTNTFIDIYNKAEWHLVFSTHMHLSEKISRHDLRIYYTAVRVCGLLIPLKYFILQQPTLANIHLVANTRALNIILFKYLI